MDHIEPRARFFHEVARVLKPGGVMVVATVFVAVNMAVDAMYGWLDPRVRLK